MISTAKHRPVEPAHSPKPNLKVSGLPPKTLVGQVVTCSLPVYVKGRWSFAPVSIYLAEAMSRHRFLGILFTSPPQATYLRPGMLVVVPQEEIQALSEPDGLVRSLTGKSDSLPSPKLKPCNRRRCRRALIQDDICKKTELNYGQETT